MSTFDEDSRARIVERLRQQTLEGAVRITIHAHQEMVEEDISLEEVYEVLLDANLVEDYPEHKRGACCLVCQRSRKGRHVHVVCTTLQEKVVIITVYEPRWPKWITAFERGQSQ